MMGVLTLLVLGMVARGQGMAGGMAGPLPAGATLPAGHPPMGGVAPTANGGVGTTMGGTTMGGTTMGGTMANMVGTLNITVVGGSANGTSVANEGVTVHLYNENGLVKNLEFKTDAAGKVTVTDIPLMPPVEIQVTVHHAGLTQTADVPSVTITEPVQAVEIRLYFQSPMIRTGMTSARKPDRGRVV